jgi:DNA processing protein
VFAIPGSIHAALAKGCHTLIREGARLVETAQDVLEALALSPLLAAHVPKADSNTDDMPDENAGTQAESALLDALGHDPVAPDVLLARLGWHAGELSANLLVLELAGRIERLAGGLIQRTGNG